MMDEDNEGGQITCYDCPINRELQEHINRSLGSATEKSASIAGFRKGEENGTCGCYEIYISFEQTVGPETTAKMFGKKPDKYCPYKNDDVGLN